MYLQSKEEKISLIIVRFLILQIFRHQLKIIVCKVCKNFLN